MAYVSSIAMADAKQAMEPKSEKKPAPKVQSPPKVPSPPKVLKTQPSSLSKTGQAMRSAAADGEVVDAAAMVKGLTDALAAQMARVIDLFREWDDDGNGMVSKIEFRRALPMLGLKVERSIGEKLFDSFDDDKSGEISYDELNSKLHEAMMARAGVELDDKLKAGAMGKIETESKNKFALRVGPAENVSAAMGTTKIDMSEGAPPLKDQLRDALQKNLARVIDLFREWDDDGNGTVSKREFRLALPMLGLVGCPANVADELFDSFDKDGGGSVDYDELSRALRPKPMGGIYKARSLESFELEQTGGAEEYKRVMEEQMAAKKELVRLQRELTRRASESALQEAKRTKLEVGRATRRAIKAELIGLDAARDLADAEPASEEEVRDLAKRFHNSMMTLFPVKAESRLWYKLFLYMDKDRSGTISYPEMKKMVRTHLSLRPAELPEPQLRRLWKALDEDAEGFITAGEFGRFMKKGEEKAEDPMQALREKRLKESAVIKAGRNLPVDGDLLRRLEEVPAASDEEVTKLAWEMTAAMSRLFPHQQRVWVKMFRAIDADGSGRIDFKEFTHMLRVQLSIPLQQLSEVGFQAIWKSIDPDNSGFINLGEFGRFIKKGEAADKKAAEDDDTARRVRHLKSVHAAKVRASAIEDNQARLEAAREAEKFTQRLKEESKRLKFALDKKRFRGVGLRVNSSKSLPGIVSVAADNAPRPEPVLARPLMPPVKVGYGVDF